MDRIETEKRGPRSGGAQAKGTDRIQLDFYFEGQRYRPELMKVPNEANLRKARELVADIKKRIKDGTFNFAEEFPEYRLLRRVAPEATEARERTLNDVVKAFLQDCTFRVRQRDLSHSTMDTYRKVLAGQWEAGHDKDGNPIRGFGQRAFFGIKLSELRERSRKHEGKKKTYNNVVSAIRCAFEFGYQDRPQDNPARGLACLRLLAKDRPEVDPYSIGDAETMVEGLRADWGESQANYDEFRFFTGLRPSEEIALLVSDCDLNKGEVQINKARVQGIDKDWTKTGVDRVVALCPRALEVLKRQLALRAKLLLAGKLDRKCNEVFFNEETGCAFHDLQVQGRRWRKTEARLKMRARDPYNARHSSVSWNLMVDPNRLLLIAEQHGHSVATMLKTYARWTKGATEADVAAIRAAFQASPARLRKAA